MHIVGARPQFIKLAPLLKAWRRDPACPQVVVHSGQHYDYEMSRIFFEQLELPEPAYHLAAGSGSHGEQTGRILIALDPVIAAVRPDLVIIYGDTNTTLAGALAAYQHHLPLAHVEAGLREHIWRPEEINKKVADHCSHFCFCPTKRAVTNLRGEGVPDSRIFLSGDITFDAFRISRDLARERSAALTNEEGFFLVTLHRAETVDRRERLEEIIKALAQLPGHTIFPVHPRTRRNLEQWGLLGLLNDSRIKGIEPTGYLEFLGLLQYCRLVLTDSGGVIKEGFYAGKPVVVLDETTEYEELVNLGVASLAGWDAHRILDAVERMRAVEFDPIRDPIFGDGRAAERMVEAIECG